MAGEFLTLNRLRDLLEREGIKPNKILGQNFLIDRNVRNKILTFADLEKEDTVVEIGPGLGSLTEGMAGKVKKIYAFEKDPKIAEIARTMFEEDPSIEIITKNFLDVDEMMFKNTGGKVKIIGNLPYCVASPILFKLLELKSYWKFALVSLPEEVARRVVAVPGEKDFGLLAVLFSIYARAETRYRLGKRVFYPIPEVNSVFIAIEPLEKPKIFIRNEDDFRKEVPFIFRYRRKSILNVLGYILKQEKDFIKTRLDEIRVNPDLRSHQLSLEQISGIADLITDCR